MSAHRTPEQAREFARDARANGFGVIIAAAGKAAHLAGALAANSTLPVRGHTHQEQHARRAGRPLEHRPDASGIPVATVAIDGAQNRRAAGRRDLAAADGDLAAKLDAMREDMAAATLRKDAALQEKLNG